MPNLFDELTGPAGYRLQLLEVFNWGTFHEGAAGQDIWRLTPNGQNTLLTGANGSGKTTLVDALLALLVHPTKRFFNQSSGARSTRDRSEESYVEGHYGRTQSEEQQHSRVEKLRPKRAETYSIILGVFTNAQSLPITLVQVRWFSGAGLQRRYLVAKAALNIAAHIRFSTHTPWVSQLKRQFADRVVEDFDAFPKYAATFQRLFGMRSDKALTLFNQTVGMKVLGNLDEFIRANMLEESSAEAQFERLMSQYQTLLTAHRALEKARTQLTLLQPVYDLSHAYDQLREKLRRTQTQQRLLTPWFARQQVALWSAESGRQDRELDRLADLLAQQEAAWDATDARRVALEVQLANNQVAQQIRDLERDITTLEKSKTEKLRDLKDYNRLARGLNLTEDPDADTFAANIERALALAQHARQQKQELDEQKFTTRSALAAQRQAFDALTTQLQQLESSTGNVTKRPAEIRQDILAAVGAAAPEIPFVAEVMRVRAEERAVWHEALEKLLHSAALALLVPERLYAAVNAYVHAQRDLRGKVVYHCVADQHHPTSFPAAHTVCSKLEFDPRSPYAAWVAHHVATRFDYRCTEDLPTFERADKALLPSGLTRNKHRHERDDSRRHDHILGWDNQELKRDLHRQGRTLNDAITQAENSLRRLDEDLKQVAEHEKRLAIFSEIKHFSKLDWQADAVQISALATQLRALEQDSTALQTLREQLRDLKAHLKHSAQERDTTKADFTRTEVLLKQLQSERQAQQRQLDTPEAAELAADPTSLDELTQPLRGTLTYGHFARQQQQLEQEVVRRLAEQHSQLRTQEKKIREAMDGFLRPGATVTDTFADWHSDTGDLRNELEQLGEYTDRYEQLRHEHLAELEARFHDEFKRGVTRALTDYCDSLENEHRKIKETIDQINDSLRGIAFNLNPDTYIQLECRENRRPSIQDFRRHQLGSWTLDRTLLTLAQNPQEVELENFVTKIQPFIVALRDQEKWRQEVTDVRNWSTFNAREYFRADKVLKQVYESSGSLSGGEGAQLAYTVLGAAIAYQFGINRDANAHKSFRFIVIDEAFSKLDEDKSAYLLKLCASLNLQLMVVTPLTSLHLLEKDVQVIHWVTKAKQDKRRSVVRDIPILAYQADQEVALAKETALQTETAAHD